MVRMPACAHAVAVPVHLTRVDPCRDEVQSVETGQVLREEVDVHRAARRLADLALRRGSSDNVCVMVLDVRDQAVGRAVEHRARSAAHRGKKKAQ